MAKDGESRSSATIASDNINNNNNTVAMRLTAANSTPNEDDGLAFLGQLEIEEQQAALRKIQAQKRREEQRRITAALRNRRRKPPPPPPPAPPAPPSFEEEKAEEEFVAEARRSCEGNTLPTEYEMLLTDDCAIQEQLGILRDIEEKNKAMNITSDVFSESSASLHSDCKPRVRHFYSSGYDEEHHESKLSDDDIIQEQQRLVDALQVSRTKPQERDSHAPIASRPASGFVPAPLVPVSPSREPKPITAWSPIKTSNGSNSYQDSTVQLLNGTRVRVKGTNHVYDCILAGKKTVFTECVNCGTVSQVNGSGGICFFYCTICEQVGPVQEIASCQQDADLAAALQNQEREVAYQRKISACSNKASYIK